MSTQALSGGTRLSLPPRDRLSHAYILVSPSADKLSLAYSLAAHMLCPKGGDSACNMCSDCRKVLNRVHPDVIVIQRLLDDEGKPRREIYVAQIREILSDSVVLPNEAACKVYIIADGDYMNTQSQNALLKLLEEPPARVRFILCTENPGVFLDTIRSRCIELTARSEESSSAVTDEAMDYLKAAASGSRIEILRFCSRMESLNAAQLQDFLSGTGLIIGEILANRRPSPGLSQHRLMEIHALLTRCLEYIQVNVSVKQVLGLLSVRTMG